MAGESDVRKRLISLLKGAAAKAVAEEDPWGKHEIEKVPAERVIRHIFQPLTKTWTQDETIVKMESTPFTHGAMRHCFRMKKMSPPPDSSANHRFHDFGWKKASNYVSKCYLKDGEIDTSEEAKEAVRNDITLQYEAQHWAKLFNDKEPPKGIIFIRAFALEFPSRPGSPWFAVERYISGTDSYGCGFYKHNTNAGFVDEDLHRVTPQVFSAFSFYESKGTRLVADIQGVGDLYTDPQVLSNDYRFGDGDLGPRGMALFFETFRHNTLAESLGIPIFPLSKNELKHQMKYEDDIYSLSGDNSSFLEALKGLDKFAKMDANRNRRQSMLLTPPVEIAPDEKQATEKRSNMSKRDEIRKSLTTSRLTKPTFKRSASEMDEVKMCLDLAKKEFKFDNKAYHRKESGEMKTTPRSTRTSLMIRKVSEIIVIDDETRGNLGKVHYQLAVLHGLGRFPEVVEVDPNENREDAPPHDSFSVLFHLAHASSLGCVPACLALGRLHAGLGTSVSPLLDHIVPVDFDAARELFRRAMESKFPPSAPKAAAGCLLYQIYLDEKDSQDYSEEEEDGFGGFTPVSDSTILHVLEDTIKLMEDTQNEEAQAKEHKKGREKGGSQFNVGDKVEGNYCLEGNFYPGVVESVSEDGKEVVIVYDDDGSKESLTLEHLRLIVPPHATQTALGGPLSDEEALGSENSDEKCLSEKYELKAELAQLKLKLGSKEDAAALFEEASNEAMSANKMKKASEWSLKAAELLE